LLITQLLVKLYANLFGFLDHVNTCDSIRSGVKCKVNNLLTRTRRMTQI